MPKINVELAVSTTKKKPIRRRLARVIPVEPSRAGLEGFASGLMAYARQEILYNEYLKLLPTTIDFMSPRNAMRFHLADYFTGHFENVANKRELWRYVGNAVLGIKFWLARARAFREVQSSYGSNFDMYALLHYEKMDKLHHAIHGIYQLRELHLHIIAEAICSPPLEVEIQRGGKTTKLKLRHLGHLVRYREKFSGLMGLDKPEWDTIQRLAPLLRASATSRFSSYRNKLVHGAPPSVDDARFYPHLQDRGWHVMRGKKGFIKKTKGIGGLGKPDWEFPELYGVVVEAFEHYLNTLRQLRAVPAFSP